MRANRFWKKKEGEKEEKPIQKGRQLRSFERKNGEEKCSE